MLEIWELAALAGVGLIAGFVDAVAGGGGLIALPALLSFGVPPVAALATNKAQSIVGTAMAAFTFWRRGQISITPMILAALAVTFVGSLLGALTVASIDTSILERMVPVAVIAVAIYFVVSPAARDLDRAARLPLVIGLPLLGAVIGYYDGVFGPGTGSFFILGLVALCGFGVTRAVAHTKLFNVMSNLAALAIFLPAGAILWPAALVMAAGQLVGGYIGARVSLRYGAVIIRPLVIVVSIALAARLLFGG